jgi:hypothetical protein
MKNIGMIFPAVISFISITPLTQAWAATGAPPMPAAARFYPLVGIWQGKGTLSQGDQSPAMLTLRFNCKKAASGWAVTCDLRAKNAEMTMTEVDLMGVDPNTDKGHWYAVDNLGDTHDHIVEWPDAKTMQAHYAWTQDGKLTEENVVFHLMSDRSMEFRSVVSQDSKTISLFSGKLKR